ncbi:predicted protein [Uncinocarpus reesii 1704]|uniref:DNA mismatch repair proteins mutS family domain-containing protein n=1 Tax=Uncinocarpus reesii (strain UAMH 1704) TaxID=336963 RepID=C4JTV4_UNCRE|nr:uncharacterized protein UREG_05893 [Uncinocarpus reesii 1704]EEP81051.1 predicted protein [Uncinocarpus reesii 1704]
MAIDMRDRGTVGCSYYVADEKKLYILADIIYGGIDVVETHAQFRLPYHLDVRPSQEFNFETARTKLSNLKLGQATDIPKFLVPGNEFSYERTANGADGGFTEEQGKLLHLASTVDMENHVSIGCAGALISYLQRKRSTQYLQGDLTGDHLSRIQAIEMLSLDSNMDTLSSLQIIQSESHPNAFNQGPGQSSSGSKESLSIYGLFHRFARTPQGKAKLRQHFLRPTIKPNVLRERHDFISTFLRSENVDATEKLITSLKGIKNLRPVMVHLQKGISTGHARFKGFKSVVWATLLEFAYHAIDIHEILKEVIGMESLDLCVKVDLEASVQEHRTIVKPRVDQGLDKLKETYNGMDSLLSQVAVTIAATLPERLGNELNVIYFPQLGFNIAIPLNEFRRPVYDGGDEGWTQVFTTENRAYFKDFRMHEMDEKLGDMYGNICEKEIEIVYELAQNILSYEEMLIEASDVCGEIDRHLLHEATVPSFVPNDTLLAALIVYMAHIGCFVPAEVATIGFTDKILTRISSRETVSKTQSTFAIDLQQVAFALAYSTNRSLIVIDEFGKGTESTDGVGLACGLFDYLLNLGDERPKVIAATHFHEMFEHGFLQQRPELQLGYMEVQMDHSASEVEDQITYLYKWVPVVDHMLSLGLC